MPPPQYPQWNPQGGGGRRLPPLWRRPKAASVEDAAEAANISNTPMKSTPISATRRFSCIFVTLLSKLASRNLVPRPIPRPWPNSWKRTLHVVIIPGGSNHQSWPGGSHSPVGAVGPEGGFHISEVSCTSKGVHPEGQERLSEKVNRGGHNYDMQSKQSCEAPLLDAISWRSKKYRF